jgi:hypothetical protein
MVVPQPEVQTADPTQATSLARELYLILFPNGFEEQDRRDPGRDRRARLFGGPESGGPWFTRAPLRQPGLAWRHR